MKKNNVFSKIKFYLTGFGEFQGLTNNPTEALMKEVQKDIKKFEIEKTEISYSKVFEVTCDYVDKHINEMHKMIEETKDQETLKVVIHFGLYKGNRHFNLEFQAKNFIKDYVSRNEMIDEGEENEIHSKVDINEVIKRMEKHNFKCKKSGDAGTYLCNYIYYKSLKKLKNSPNTLELFVHVPDIEDMSLNKQQEFLKKLLNTFSDLYLNKQA